MAATCLKTFRAIGQTNGLRWKRYVCGEIGLKCQWQWRQTKEAVKSCIWLTSWHLIIQEMAPETRRLFTRRWRVRPSCIRQGTRRRRRQSPAAVSDADDTASRTFAAGRRRSIAEPADRLLRRVGMPTRPDVPRSPPPSHRRRRGVGWRPRLVSGWPSARARLWDGGRWFHYSLSSTGRHHARRLVPTTRPDADRRAVDYYRWPAAGRRQSLSPCTEGPRQAVNPSPPIPLRLYTLPYWSNPPFFDIRALWTKRQSARMSKIKNVGLDQYGTEPFEQQHLEHLALKGLTSLGVLYLSACGVKAQR